MRPRLVAVFLSVGLAACAGAGHSTHRTSPWLDHGDWPRVAPGAPGADSDDGAGPTDDGDSGEAADDNDEGIDSDFEGFDDGAVLTADDEPGDEEGVEDFGSDDDDGGDADEWEE